MVHKAEATGLMPDTAYYFRVGDQSLDIWSEVGTFKTAPVDGEFTFIDLTDTQAKEEDEAILSGSTLAKALATVPNAEFVVHNGDVVENGTSEQEWNWLLGHSQDSLMNTTIAPSAGNHENKNYAFYEHFNVKQPEGAETKTGAYYSYDYSKAHFIVLNSNENSAEYANFSNEQVAWMKQDVAEAKAAGAEWIIVNIHKGPYTTSNHATDSDIIGDASRQVWSETGTFRTAPEKGKFTFIDLADTQAKEEDEAILSSETLAKALATVPDAQFVVHNGDIVDNGIKEEQWNWLLGHSQESLLNTTIVPSAGNHEDKNYAFIDHFNIQSPENSATETGAYYSYDYSNAHFVVLNSNEDSDEYDNFSVEQVEWLKKDVQAAKKNGAQWIIVNIHKGPYTTSNHATDSDIMGANGVRTKIAPIMAELGIDFVLQGHDHIYARTKPIDQNGKARQPEIITEMQNGEKIEYSVNPNGSIYLIPATAGPKVYYKNPSPSLGDAYYSLFELAEENHAAKYGPDPNDDRRPKRSQVQNFVGITIDGSKLTAITYEIDQNLNGATPFIIDQFAGHWAKSAIDKALAAGFVNGYGDQTFRPNQKVTRAEFITMLGRALNMNTVSESIHYTDDNKIPSWAKSYITAAASAGIINGYANGSFGPGKTLNRAEMVTMIARAGGIPTDSNAKLDFKDAKDVPAWAVSHVASAVEAGLVGGVGGNRFAPMQTATRAEAVTLIIGLLEQTK
ncbi:hypothetical protein G195_000295 [Phytophthora kernoviae 00238/432]|uniref:Purple acid phosphatase n=1 Tax=Phytophthora kernoviae 00238/432 TaxID=1284355 RepID=A0A8J4SMM5_9STRA|nr:hypothetical protein G195_000295 [Phytophthora kernoviae 00238/432]